MWNDMHCRLHYPRINRRPIDIHVHIIHRTHLLLLLSNGLVQFKQSASDLCGVHGPVSMMCDHMRSRLSGRVRWAGCWRWKVHMDVLIGQFWMVPLELLHGLFRRCSNLRAKYYCGYVKGDFWDTDLVAMTLLYGVPQLALIRIDAACIWWWLNGDCQNRL